MRVDSCHAASVAEHRDPVGDAENLVEAMRDIDDPDAACPEPPQRREQPLDVGIGKCRRRLVEHKDVGLHRQRPADGDQRAFGGGEGGDAGVRDRGRSP